jgi:hypothetical protein
MRRFLRNISPFSSKNFQGTVAEGTVKTWDWGEKPLLA